MNNNIKSDTESVEEKIRAQKAKIDLQRVSELLSKHDTTPPPGSPVPPTSTESWSAGGKQTKSAVSQGQKQSVPKEQERKARKQVEQTVSDDLFQTTLLTAITKFSRDQQTMLAKAIAGVLGAHISFPEARETRARKELLELVTNQGQGNATETKAKPKSKNAKKDKEPTQKKQAKPENLLLRSSPEAKQLKEAQAAVRALRVSLGLAKDNTTDPRLKVASDSLLAAKTAFDAKRSEVRQGVAEQH